MPAGDFFGRGVAPMQDPFSAYLNPKTMTQARSTQPNWGNVGYGSQGSPFGQNQGDISEAGWQNPIDVFTRQAERDMAKMAGQPTGGAPTGTAGGLSANNPTQYDQAFVSAAREMSAKYGVTLDPALVKAMAHIESGGTFTMPVRPSDGSDNYPAVGMMQVKPQYWQGLANEIGADIYDPIGNIRVGAAIMAQSMAQGRTWQQALTSTYFTTDDINGTTQQDYINMATQYMQQYSDGSGGLAAGGTASGVVQSATSFVGKVPYVLGGIPGKGENPTAWDCSGFMYWLDQNYGGSDLPMGSHEQYAYGVQTGRLAQRDPQVGDLVFFNTGASFRGNAASHVGMYIGNGQFVHAANPNDGTIISDFNAYKGMYGFMGSMSMSWSGGGAYSAPMQGGAANYGYGSGSLFGTWDQMMDPNAAWRTYNR